MKEVNLILLETNDFEGKKLSKIDEDTEAYLATSQNIFHGEFLWKIVNGFQPLTIFTEKLHRRYSTEL